MVAVGPRVWSTFEQAQADRLYPNRPVATWMHSTPSSPTPSARTTVRVVFFDAEGTLWVPRPGRTFADFWAEPTNARARHVFELAPDCLETLDALRAANVRLVVVSKHNEAILPGLLELFGLAGHFDDVLINGDKGHRIRDWLRAHRMTAGSAVMVGDRMDLDILPARREGVRALLVDMEYNQGERAERIDGLGQLVGLCLPTLRA